MYKHSYLAHLALIFVTFTLYPHMPPAIPLPTCIALVHTQAYLEKKLLKALEKAQTNLVATRIPGIQPLLAKLITPLGQLALQCLQLYKFKEVSSLIQVIKHFAHTALVALKHIPLIRVVSTVAHVLTALHSNTEYLRKNIHKLIQAYKKGNYYALGKTLMYITKTLVGRTLAHEILHTSFKIARIQNLNTQYTKALSYGLKRALYSANHRKLLTVYYKTNTMYLN